MLTVENRVGRLIELRGSGPMLAEDAESGARELVKVLLKIEGKAVGCVDLRRSGLLRPEGAARFIEIMKRDNPKIERNAFILLEAKATLSLQIERLIREAGSPSRRLFHSAVEAQRWLNESLHLAVERARLAAFLEDFIPPK